MCLGYLMENVALKNLMDSKNFFFTRADDSDAVYIVELT